ncbi:MAG TPA: hypothetical protein V6D17_17215 [Candidatus Obscuribacterales bacterium]
MPISEPFEERQHPKLKLEVIRGGTGSGGVTAVGLKNDDGEAGTPQQWDSIPLWFKVFIPIGRSYCRHLLKNLSVNERSLLLKKSGLLRRYRVLLSGRWHFQLDETINRSDAKDILAATSTSAERFSAIMTRLDQQAVWKILRYWLQ